MKHLIIIGIGGFAREVFWHAHESRGYGADWDIKGFLDGDVKLAPEEYEKLSAPVVGDVVSYEPQPEDCFICAVGSPKVKGKLVQGILDKGGEFINIIHRTAIVHPTAQMGQGNIICPFVLVTDHAKIGNFVTLNARSAVGHDVEIGAYSSLMAVVDITGGVKVGVRTYWGSGARALPYSRVDDDVTIGIASVVFKHAKAGITVFGNPAMPI